jgi:hypothetical protein
MHERKERWRNKRTEHSHHSYKNKKVTSGRENSFRQKFWGRKCGESGNYENTIIHHYLFLGLLNNKLNYLNMDGQTD